MQPIYATSIKINKSCFHLTLRSGENLKNAGVYLVRQEPDPAVKERTLLPFCCAHKGENVVEAELDIAEMDTDHVDWSVLVSFDPVGPGEGIAGFAETETELSAALKKAGASEAQEGSAAPEDQKRPSSLYPVLLGGILRVRLILGNYEYRREGRIFFPMGSTGHRLILRCRPATKYDGPGTRLKEFFAFGLYRVLRPVWNKKRIWVMFEKYSFSAQDNGFYFFRYCMENLEEKDRKRIFYILDRDSAQWPAVEKYRRNVIPFMSFRHILYMLAARLYVASDSRIHGYLWQPKPNLISREINRHDIYFLQHGVLALKRVEKLFGRNGACPVTYFTASSAFERDIVVREFGYDPENVPVVGLARWDVLENHEDPGRPSILVMPTWRSWLEYLDDEEFRKSEYYRRYTSLIQNRELLDLLKDRGAELIFYIHPKLSRYMKNFHTDSSLVKLISFGEEPLNRLLMECSMLVTDYSSVCWDVYYQEKPLLFYQFDLDLYEKTNGSYIDMEKDLFGERCTEETELVEKLKEYMADGFREKEIYAAMRPGYFAYRDHSNCRRTYEYIIGKGY